MYPTQPGGPFCPWCGAPVPAGAQQCRECGRQVEAAAAIPAPPPYQPVTYASAPPIPPAAPAPRRVGVAIAVTLAGLALVGAGVLVWLLLSRDDGGRVASPTATTADGGSASPTAGGDNGNAGTGTMASTSTSTSTTTTTAPTTTLDPTIDFEVPPPSPGTVAPGYGAGMSVNGTGCTSDQGPPAGYWTLYPNGTWFGFIRSVNHESWGGGWIEFDMGCFYEGWAADVEADHDGTSPFRDIYVRNDYGHLFNPDVESGAKVWWVDAYGDHREVDFSDWPGAVGGSVLDCPGRGCAVWIYVRGGAVYRIVEQPDVTADGAW